jgi:hypothetical protein
VGIFRLSFPHHVNQFNPAQDHASVVQKLESQNRPDPPLDRPMILFDSIIEVGTLPDPDRLQIASRPILEPVFRIAGQHRFSVSLAIIDHDPLGPAMTFKCLAQKPFGCSEVAPLTEPELDRITIAVNCAVVISPLPTNLYVGFVDVPLGSDSSLAGVEAIQKFRRVADNPPMYGSMIEEMPRSAIISSIFRKLRL